MSSRRKMKPGRRFLQRMATRTRKSTTNMHITGANTTWPGHAHPKWLLDRQRMKREKEIKRHCCCCCYHCGKPKLPGSPFQSCQIPWWWRMMMYASVDVCHRPWHNDRIHSLLNVAICWIAYCWCKLQGTVVLDLYIFKIDMRSKYGVRHTTYHSCIPA